MRSCGSHGPRCQRGSETSSPEAGLLSAIVFYSRAQSVEPSSWANASCARSWACLARSSRLLR
ncbi:hypothetical protein CsSME_00025914 [Camellia sinensis var. sinensis]